MKEILVRGDKTFKIKVPDHATITFGPWSPPGSKEQPSYGGREERKGTLRIYDGPRSTSNIIAVFSGVTSFRDTSIDYSEEVAVEQGASLWKSDREGYVRSEESSMRREWVKDEPKRIVAKATKKRAR